jgi:hypothetical protein
MTSFLLVFILSANAFATTWFPKEFICPIDKEKNTFQVWASYGSYIYSWPSKYQWVFWPATESEAFYLCKKCHLTTYMWDYEKIPADKIPELKKILADIKVSKEFKDYREVPITERLEIMERSMRCSAATIRGGNSFTERKVTITEKTVRPTKLWPPENDHSHW